MSEHLEQFQPPEEEAQTIKFVEKVAVTDGVTCFVYEFVEDGSRDLGIVTVEPGKKTPLQLVLQGSLTIEGHISGNGKLVVDHENGNRSVYVVSDEQPLAAPVAIQVGDILQWQADENSTLTFFEICYPPYQEGRFKNLKGD